MHRIRTVVVATLAAGVIAACNRSARTTTHVSLSSLDQIRTAFNADSGKVRAIFLASPT